LIACVIAFGERFSCQGTIACLSARAHWWRSQALSPFLSVLLNGKAGWGDAQQMGDANDLSGKPGANDEYHC
jgi:hypothetical protein